MKTFKEYIKEGREWVGVDLDGTLAHYTHWKGVTKIGKPIPKMVDRIKKMLDNGEKVKIFTARANDPKAVEAIKKWLVTIGLPELEVTNIKDQYMVSFYDDRAIQVVKNTGEIVGDQDISLEEKLGIIAAGLLAGSTLLPNMMQAKEQPKKAETTLTQSSPLLNFNHVINLILQHEGLLPKQTPFRITNPEMKRWNNILGFKVDKSEIPPPERKNFIFLENPNDVPKAVRKQFQNYANNPSKYGLKPNVTLKDALAKFDQSGVKGKIEFLLKNIPNLDLNKPLKEFLG